MAAVTVFVSRRPHPLRAFGFGVRWALGHSLAILLAGGIVLALGVRLPAALVSLLELGVGVMLLGLGIWVIAGAVRSGHGGELAAHPAGAAARRHAHGTTWVGAAHGLAGTAGFLALVPAAMLASPVQAGAYLALFGLGTMLAMGAYAAGAGLLLQRAGGTARFGRYVRIGAGMASAAVGVAWLLRLA